MPDAISKRVDLFGFPLDIINLDEAVAACTAAWAEKRRLRVLTLNPIMVETGLRDASAASVIKGAGLVIPDGVGVTWAVKKLYGIDTPLLPGIELASALIDECAKSHRQVFLLGGAEGVAAEAAEELSGDRMDLRIVGTHHGYFKPEDEGRVIEMVNASGAALVLCGMGFPRQDIILQKIIESGAPPPCYDGNLACELPGSKPPNAAPPIPPMVAIGVGGSLDVFAGRVKRPSEIWQKFRLEWLARIMSEPEKRLSGLPVLLRFWWRVQMGRKV